MKKIDFDFMTQRLKRWAPAAIGISAMLLLSSWFPVARFFLFGHHLFWIIATMLVIISLSRVPYSTTHPRKVKPAQTSAKVRQQVEARQRTAKPKPAPISETPAERLARLRKQKEVVDQKIEKLTAQGKK